MLRGAGYHTGVVGKWHLGLGGPGGPDWNARIAPGPNEVGFAYSFIMAATGDRVPTVYVEDGRVVGLDPNDPIRVAYDKKVGDWPTGRENPELLTTQRPSHGHDQTIVNGVSRIGYMTGGKAALWRDQDMADTFTRKAVSFIERHQREPFFLFFATHDPHVPRVPHERFVGKSGMGPRGDAILQSDWSIGQVLDTLDRLKLADNTLVIFTSDNGPVVDDGYVDQAVEKLGAHTPAGPLRGGKYSRFEAGTRVPFVVRWPARVRPGVSDALVSQVDLLASLAALVGQAVPAGEAPDSLNQLRGPARAGPEGPRSRRRARRRAGAARRPVEVHRADERAAHERADQHRAGQRPAAAALRPRDGPRRDEEPGRAATGAGQGNGRSAGHHSKVGSGAWLAEAGRRRRVPPGPNPQRRGRRPRPTSATTATRREGPPAPASVPPSGRPRADRSSRP